MRSDDRNPCAETKARLSHWLDGDLPPEEAASVQAHLASCAPCANLAAELGALRDALARLPAAEFPPGLAERIRRQAESERLLRRDRRLRPGRPVWATAALILLAAGLTWRALPPDAAPAPGHAQLAIVQPLADARQEYQYALAFLEAQASGLLPLAPAELRQPIQSEMAQLDQLIEDRERTIAGGRATLQTWETLLDVYQCKVELLALFLSADEG
ncbi:MAG TPA: zf-HC2 domain-containing protein [Acidobacteriota bacterium]|nr:zf-HC2 domain-containing protein [Acidobacteriota bacterium]HQF85679.1 zf-HC2 domain-containing protein [Acidobacteriota bacterium]HQG91077.1 zf-HC2 domain-containing protein [Acidobacteriota bacterium]HQK86871.1 zf-HC2 domain-containing protein [Acidobacteriota bacterium]